MKHDPKSPKSPLTEREELFCEYFARTCDPGFSAARAGWRVLSEHRGLRFLREKRIRDAIRRLQKENAIPSASSGLARLAFGSNRDAIRLALCEEPMSAEELDRLDLYAVSEFKRPKGGGVELKFFDRIKALEALANLQQPEDGNSGMRDFVNAMRLGAQSLAGDGEESS